MQEVYEDFRHISDIFWGSRGQRIGHIGTLRVFGNFVDGRVGDENLATGEFSSTGEFAVTGRSCVAGSFSRRWRTSFSKSMFRRFSSDSLRFVIWTLTSSPAKTQFTLRFWQLPHGESPVYLVMATPDAPRLHETVSRRSASAAASDRASEAEVRNISRIHHLSMGGILCWFPHRQ